MGILQFGSASVAVAGSDNLAIQEILIVGQVQIDLVCRYHGFCLLGQVLVNIAQTFKAKLAFAAYSASGRGDMCFPSRRNQAQSRPCHF